MILGSEFSYSAFSYYICLCVVGVVDVFFVYLFMCRFLIIFVYYISPDKEPAAEQPARAAGSAVLITA